MCLYCTAVVRWENIGWGVYEETEGGEGEWARFPMTVCYTLAFVLAWWVVLCLRDSQRDGAEKVVRVNWGYGRGLEY